MPVYTFHMQSSEGPPATWSRADLPNDLAAVRHADELIGAHPGADGVTVLDGHRHVVYIVGAGASGSTAAVRRAVEASKACISASLHILRENVRS